MRKKVFSALWSTTKLTAKATVSTAKMAGNALHGAAKFVAEHKEEISAGARFAVKTTGSAVQFTGQVVKSGANAASNALHGAAKQSDSKLAKVAGHAVGYAVDAVSIAGTATSRAGKLVGKSAPVTGAAAGGIVAGAVATTSRVVDSVVVTQRDIEVLTNKLRLQSSVLRSQSRLRQSAISAAIRGRRKNDLLDLLVVGGVTLSAVLKSPHNVSSDVEMAFARAYPGLADQGQTFADAVARMDAESLLGLVNGVKGKLFELQLVEHLNDGNLPDGLHAELASSAAQPGFDVRILDENGQTVEVLQAKATESAAYVKEALDRYPDIDVMTTTEVHSRLVAMGVADQVADSGISEEALQAKVDAAATSADGFDLSSYDVLPSSLGMAIVALSVFTTRGATIDAMADQFGQRAAKASLGTMAGKAAVMASGIWWIGLASGLGATWLSSYGGDKRDRYEALKRTVRDVNNAVTRNRLILQSSPRAVLLGR